MPSECRPKTGAARVATPKMPGKTALARPHFKQLLVFRWACWAWISTLGPVASAQPATPAANSATTTTAPATAPSAPVNCSAPAFKQMDFWLGQWDVRWDASPGTPAGSGSNTVKHILGGCVLQEDFNGGPASGNLVGRSVSVYHAPSQHWRQTWVDNQGGHFALVGGPQGQDFVLTGPAATPERPAFRMRFEAITERSLTWRWQSSADSGNSWSDRWVIHYTRASTPTWPDAAALAERLFAAIGGRAVWAALHNTVNDSQQFRLTEPTQVRAVITMDFMRPRWRIDTTAPGLNISRVVNGPRDWRRTREGQVAPLSAATREADLQWHTSHIYRTLSRVARQEAGVGLRTGNEGRLEVLEQGRRIAWLKLGADGQPYAFGGADDGPGSLSGPWQAGDQGVLHPVWVSSADGSWRSSLNRLQVNVKLDDALFDPPAPTSAPK